MRELRESPILDRAGSAPLRVIWRTDAERITLAVEGDIDLGTCGQLDSQLQAAEKLATPGGRVVLNLSWVDFLGAAGLHVLEHSRCRCAELGIGFAVVAGCRAVTRPIELTGLAGQLNLTRPPAHRRRSWR